MSEERKEPWLNYLALATVILAVCATLSTFKGAGYSTRSVLAQSQASDQWAYFQAKGIKGYLYELQRDKLELELNSLKPSASQSVLAEYQKKVDGYSQKIQKYDEEKVKIEQEARALEARRDESQKHSQAFGMAVIFLQIAILLSSISALMKLKYVWIIGLVTGAFGVVYFINGFFCFM
jgi:cation transport ATPase